MLVISFVLSINNEYRIGFESRDLDDNDTDINLMTKNYLPGSEIDNSGNKVNFWVEYVKSSNKQLEIGTDKITIYDDWGGKISLDLWHLLYSIVRLYYLRLNIYSIHAACVGINKYVLLAGHSGVGKTTILMKLANDFGAKIFSGNKTVIKIDDKNEFWAMAATRAISFRQEDLKKYPNLEEELTGFSNRAAMVLQDKYYSTDKTVQINTIFIVKINDNADETTTLKYPTNMHLMYPYFLDTVYADTIMCDGKAVFSGEIDKEIKNNLAQKLSLNLNKIATIKISGSVNYIITEIIKWL